MKGSQMMRNMDSTKVRRCWWGWRRWQCERIPLITNAIHLLLLLLLVEKLGLLELSHWRLHVLILIVHQNYISTVITTSTAAARWTWWIEWVVKIEQPLEIFYVVDSTPESLHFRHLFWPNTGRNVLLQGSKAVIYLKEVWTKIMLLSSFYSLYICVHCPFLYPFLFIVTLGHGSPCDNYKCRICA